MADTGAIRQHMGHRCGATAAGRERQQRGTQSCNVGLTNVILALTLVLADSELLLCGPKELRACRQSRHPHGPDAPALGTTKSCVFTALGC